MPRLGTVRAPAMPEDHGRIGRPPRDPPPRRGSYHMRQDLWDAIADVQYAEDHPSFNATLCRVLALGIATWRKHPGC